MGALPKRKVSSRRGGNRRSQWRAVTRHLSDCPRCRSPRQSHHACPRCGFYKEGVSVAVPLPEAPGGGN
jgi:large subunit ribosomal protein L32